MNQNSTHKGIESFVMKISNSIKVLLALAAVFITVDNQVMAQTTNPPGRTNLIVDSAITAAAAKKNFASIGDYVWIDNNINGIQERGEPGLPNVEVVLYDSLLNIIDSKYTDDSGYYHFNNIPVPAVGSKTFIAGFNNIPRAMLIQTW